MQASLENLQRKALTLSASQDQNEITGSVPTRLLRRMSSLQVLNLGTNKLSGTLPIELEALSNLKTLVLSANSWTGAIPSQLGAVDSLGTWPH